MADNSSMLPLEFPAPPEMYGPEENWRGKTDGSQRRKLQNRLNQRVLRKRRAARQEEAASAAGVESQSQLQRMTHGAEEARYVELIWSTLDIADCQTQSEPLPAPTSCLMGRPGSRDVLTRAVLAAHGRYRMCQPDLSQFVDVLRFNVFYAFAHNARILGFNDDWLKDESVSPLCKQRPHPQSQSQSQSQAMSADVPWNMKPTELQLAVEHHPWVDFFPCPRMRDNFLRRVRDHGEDAAFEDALCADIVDGASARTPDDVCLVTWGKPWELSGWEVTENFLKKWPWLLEGCTELIASSNNWREARDLQALNLVEEVN
ncbi:hypothetical protein QQS21_008119 [Conoideocrella luteorostrata]|uniref:BZIP domain-containing protein n=1 Tax=Conoideocrella luteorostrata TaxID=1105319 RepID=A0AAJ0FYY3_9HYPO|nr:hypothetical protein QQS21_008119 [Conoideocrella luteorostrata]